MSNINTTKEQIETESTELLDCGQASEMTKGAMFFYPMEPAWPPFDHQPS